MVKTVFFVFFVRGRVFLQPCSRAINTHFFYHLKFLHQNLRGCAGNAEFVYIYTYNTAQVAEETAEIRPQRRASNSKDTRSLSGLGVLRSRTKQGLGNRLLILQALFITSPVWISCSPTTMAERAAARPGRGGAPRERHPLRPHGCKVITPG